MCDRKNKVLHIVGGMNIGGTETMLINLYRKINKDLEFHFVSYYDHEGYYDKEIEQLGGKVIRIPSPSKVGRVESVKELQKVIKNYGPYDSVHTHTLFNCGIGVLAAKLSGVDVRVSHAHTTLDNSESFIRKVYLGSMRTLIKLCSTDYLSCSHSAGEYLFGKSIKGNKNYKMLPNYVDYERFLKCDDKISIREQLGIKSDDIVVGHVGRFMDAKNHKFLVEVIHEMVKKDNKVKAILVGDGVLKEEVEKQVKDLGLENNIFLLGLREDINVIFNNVDLFVFPSIYEGFGLVMLEAQACGLPCLVSEAVQPEADLNIGLVNQMELANGVTAWAEKALEICKDKNKDKNKIVNAFKEKGYDLDGIVNELLKVYKVS